MILQCKREVDDDALVHADSTPEQWLTYGKNYAEDRYSSLTQINKNNVGQLSLAWSINLGTKRGIETTPLVIGHMMYLTGPWSKVFAIDARQQKIKWTYDPNVPGKYGAKACCDVVNRGLAAYQGKLFLGALDGRLIALDATTGNLIWETQTVDTSLAYTITGAPRVIAGKVIMGNGGADFGVRGYVSAYDAESGKQLWRFYTVPGNPALPFESKAMEKAAQTWTGEWWKYGGGGTAWDAMAYDPELHLLYIGTGNGGPINRKYRSPGGGDNLFLSSILALNPDSGILQWHYQTTPGDTWDYTATQHLILADLEIEGSLRKVIMQAPKNGFFYVLDRKDGTLISAKPYTSVNWASAIDKISGRPIENKLSRYEEGRSEIYPGPLGGHNWQPMAFHKKLKLVYIPVQNAGMGFSHDPDWVFDASGQHLNTGLQFNPLHPVESDANKATGQLLAWDPVRQEPRWAVNLDQIWNGGVLATASDLVFQGTGNGYFRAYDAQTGSILWEKDLETGIIGSPITYEVGGVQYITIVVGWGGVAGLSAKYTPNVNPGTVYTFALGGDATMPVFEHPKKEMPDLRVEADQATLAAGQSLYLQHCQRCHGQIGGGGGAIPDLAFAGEATYNNFQSIVSEGALESKGMPAFQNDLDEKAITQIKQYILSRIAEERARR